MRLAAALPTALTPTARPPPLPPAPELAAAFNPLPAAEGDTGLFRDEEEEEEEEEEGLGVTPLATPEAAELAAAAGGSLAAGEAAAPEVGPAREAPVSAVGFARAPEAVADTKARREVAAALAAAGAPVRLDVLGLGRVAVVGGLVDFGLEEEEEEEEGEGLAAGVVEEGEVVAVEEAERKAAVDASSLSRRIL